MLDWLIVGGGIHGTLLSRYLTAKGRVPAHRIRVLDARTEALSSWRHCTGNTGMQFLRSAGVHHLDVEAQSLYRFAASRAGRRHARFLAPFRRPSLALLDAHTEHLLDHHGLRSLRVRGTATALARRGSGLAVETSEGALVSRRVVLSIGLGNQPHWPVWAKAAQDAGACVRHIFAPDFELPRDVPGRDVIVVGGGITAVQTAMHASRSTTGAVTLVTRHPWRVHIFDAEPCWLGPACLAEFWGEHSYDARRRLITAARYRGSVPREILIDLKRRESRGELREVLEPVVAGGLDAHGRTVLRLASGGTIDADLIILATGFERRRPGGAFVDDAVTALGLPCAACGYPVPGRDLRWGQGLYVTGALAELEVGPAARNIAGAIHAAERLVNVARSDQP